MSSSDSALTNRTDSHGWLALITHSTEASIILGIDSEGVLKAFNEAQDPVICFFDQHSVHLLPHDTVLFLFLHMEALDGGTTVIDWLLPLNGHSIVGDIVHDRLAGWAWRPELVLCNDHL